MAALDMVRSVDSGLVSEPAKLTHACLAEAPIHKVFQITQVVAPATAPEWAARLAEIGFLVGETVQVLARGGWGKDPLAVRVGSSTFALRRAEAACVQIVPLSAA